MRLCTINHEEIIEISIANRELLEFRIDLIVIDKGVFLVVEIIRFRVFPCNVRIQSDIAVLRDPNELILRKH